MIRRSFLKALGFGSVVAVVAPASLAIAHETDPRGAIQAAMAASQLPATPPKISDVELMARYALEKLHEELPGNFAATSSPVHHFGVDFTWDDEATIDVAAKQLAAECKARNVRAFAVPLLPKAVEQAASVRDVQTNLALRVVRAWDLYHDLYITRIDIAGA